MKSRLSLSEQYDRFGMSQEEANALKNWVEASFSDRQKAEARAAWRELILTRDWKPHPEAVRFRLLRELDQGKSIEAATANARHYALTGE